MFHFFHSLSVHGFWTPMTPHAKTLVWLPESFLGGCHKPDRGLHYDLIIIITAQVVIYILTGTWEREEIRYFLKLVPSVTQKNALKLLEFSWANDREVVCGSWGICIPWTSRLHLLFFFNKSAFSPFPMTLPVVRRGNAVFSRPKTNERTRKSNARKRRAS